MHELCTALSSFYGENARPGRSDGLRACAEIFSSSVLLSDLPTRFLNHGGKFFYAVANFASYLLIHLFKLVVVIGGCCFLWTERLFPFVARTWRCHRGVGSRAFCCRANRDNSRHAGRPVDNCDVVPNLSPELSFDRPGIIWERRNSRQVIHCCIFEQNVDFLSKSRTWRSLTRKCLSYSQSCPRFMGIGISIREKTPLRSIPCQKHRGAGFAGPPVLPPGGGWLCHT